MTGRTSRFRVEGLLVDMDGTLLDSTAAIEADWRRFAVRWGLDPVEVLGTVHGRRTTDVIAHYADRLPIPHEQALAVHRQDSHIGSVEVASLPGSPHRRCRRCRCREAVP